MIWITKTLWLIPALPLLAAGLSALAKQRARTLAASLAIGSMVLALFLSCAAFVTTLSGHGAAARQVHNFDWFVLGETTLKLGCVLDPLTAAMLVMITFVGLLIFIYSVGYMARDENFARFFCFLSLFAAAMLGVVIANSLLLLFIGWELVGFTSYLLIGFWYHKPSAAAAARKAFITTRVGDVFFFLGLLWLYSETGTLLFYDGGAGCLEQSALAKLVGQATLGGMAMSTAVALLIFCGAMGKSGQVPLHVWLPDAMEGPTPVSALIHAATMVAAGVFLVARVYPLMEATPEQFANAKPLGVIERALAPALSLSERERENVIQSPAETERVAERVRIAELEPALNEALPLPKREGRGDGEQDSRKPSVSFALKTVTWIGAITAVFAALIAVAQTDIKRILAYSTVSQLGFMFIGLGVGGVAVGMFHLITHAFFKALLFLGAGSVIHGCDGEQDIRRMGGLRRFLPLTFATYAVGMMALTGVPLLFSGFWSKDEIIYSALHWSPSRWPFFLGLTAALLTAFYMTRQICYVFLGCNRAATAPGPEVIPPSPAAPQAEIAPEGLTTSEEQHIAKTLKPLPVTEQIAHARAPHESPLVMTLPLAVLAACAVLLSLVGTPLWPWFHEYLSGRLDQLRAATSIRLDLLGMMLLSSCIVVGGIAGGWWVYGRRLIARADEPDRLQEWQPGVFSLLREKFFIDELYAITVVRWNEWCARASRRLDDKLWSGAVMAVSYLVLMLSWLNRLIDEFVLNLGFDRSCGGLRLGARLLSLWQNGQVQRYLRVIALALAILAVIFIWGCQ
jgi:NADH:ubiquinone oxidoreductase subunit 5 (subunit L)/multisubunit Na+/H+ antiporter MnhA subunit